MTGNPELIAVIRREIEDRGPITFARFMELALYHPQHGYYTCGKERIGKRGDFITSPTVGPVFGRFLGIQFAVMWESMGKPDPFVLLEIGANRGWLAEDVMQWARERRPDFAEAIDYWICDQNQRLIEGEKRPHKWFTDWRMIDEQSVTGCIFSNELVGSFPVHRVRRQNGEWKEIHVRWHLDRFVFETQPLTFTIKDLPRTLRYLPYPNGYTTEVNFVMRSEERRVG